MQIPLQITIRDMPTSAVLEDHIREKAAKLEHFYPALVGCRVVVELPHKHKQHGKLFNVRIDLTVPGSEIVINRDQSEDVYVALRDAFDAANRKLEDYGRRQRGDVKTHEGRVEESESPDPDPDADAEDGTQSNAIPPG
ncbi:MAG: HPF/RaiA family ribosome-associated protein [Sulfuriferula sp.]